MYRQGIGDSFLLSFRQGAATAHLLIDCGVLVGTPNGKQWAQDIADDVQAETAGKLGAIVGTHPHWDHLSGFLDAQTTFAGLSGIGEIWMGWTEDPKDPAGRMVTATHAAQLDAVRLAMGQLAGVSDQGVRDQAGSVADIMAFFGPGDTTPGLAASGGGRTQDAVDALRGLSALVKYWNPGDVITRDWLPGVRIYVLGPPRDEKMLSKMLSSKPGDMYSLGSDSGFASALRAQSESAVGTADAATWDTERPFDSSWLFDRNAAAANPELLPVTTRYLAADAAWRTIDEQWLLAAETLALQLDNAINNLSLVLAFEFVASGDVLLFPADAQVGNWLSWQTLSWKFKDAQGQDRAVDTKDLLGRTVFYKVGHHGSHNATLQNGGLEDMSHPGLTAAIPVNEVFAKGTKHWEMPAAKLYQRLQERTEGRLLRSDGVGPYAVAADTQPIPNAAWTTFANNVFVDGRTPPLYVDYYLP
ncbi:MAG: hypothetical protein ACM36C_10945 [Acidobacteriota bacterium]